MHRMKDLYCLANMLSRRPPRAAQPAVSAGRLNPLKPAPKRRLYLTQGDVTSLGTREGQNRNRYGGGDRDTGECKGEIVALGRRHMGL